MASKSMPMAQLGKDGPSVPHIGFGLMGLSNPTYGGYMPDDEERFKILDRALEMGNTFWDTSDLYGDNEALLGKWFKRTGKRDAIFLATKFGFVRNDAGISTMQFSFDASGKYCKTACEKSLQVMGIDCIDLYYMHHADKVTPIEETMRALAELQAEGKIKHIGLSNVSSTCLRRAMKIAPVACVQVEYAAFTPDIETASGTHLRQTCAELSVAIVCYSPLGRGLVTSTFSTGQYGNDPKDMRTKVFPRLSEENRDANVQVMRDFAGLAQRTGCSVSQLALAWLVAQGRDVIPIPGTRTVRYLEENWAALGVELSEGEEREVREFVAGSGLVGEKIIKKYLGMLLADTPEEKE